MFDTTLSRNAVIGRLDRHKIKLQGPPCRPIGDVRAPRPKHIPLRVVRQARIIMEEPKPAGDTGQGCQWLHGEASARLFCGAVCVQLTAWCDHHYGRVYQRGSSWPDRARARHALERVA